MRLPFLAAGPAKPPEWRPAAKAIAGQSSAATATWHAPGTVASRAIARQDQAATARARSRAVARQDQAARARGRSRVLATQDQRAVATGSGAANLWPNGYLHQHEIRLRAWSATGGSVANFLLPFAKQSDAFKTVASGGEVESSDGYDIRFETTGGTKLGHRLISYDGTAGWIIALVNMPRNFTVAESIFMYLGKAGLGSSEESAANARAGGWLAWFKGGSGTDLTGQDRDLTASGTPGSTTLLGWPSYNFDGVDDYLGQADTSWLNGKTAVSAVALYEAGFQNQLRELFNVSVDTAGELSFRFKATDRRLVAQAKFGASSYLMESANDTQPGDPPAPSQYVKVAIPYWTTLAPSNILSPGSWNEEAENNFNPGAGKVIDLRGREGRNHIAGEQGRVTLVNLTAAAGAGLFGFKCRGMQTPGDTSPILGPTQPLPWQAMKFGSNGVYQTGSLASDGSWDDKHVKINGSINGTVYIEDFASYDSMDGIDTGDTGNQDYKLVLRRFYGRGNRDDFIQNDQLKEIEAEDFLIDGCHFFCSVRPGGDLSTTKNITFRNGLIRLRRQRYFGNWGGGGDPSWNSKALYTAPWADPNNRGLPELSSGQDGFGHNQLIKDSAGFQGQVRMTDCLILMESVPLGGPGAVSFPAGVYSGVKLLYVGETPVTITVPTGMTLETDRAAAWSEWQVERQRWLELHGNFDGTGNDFSFLH